MHVKKPSACLSMPEHLMNSDVGYVVVKFSHFLAPSIFSRLTLRAFQFFLVCLAFKHFQAILIQEDKSI